MRRTILTAALALALAPTAQAAAKKPDLTISKAAMSGTTVTWTVKSAGAAAKKSTTGLVLSKDAKLDKTDVKLGSFAQKAIKKGKTQAGKLVVKTPSGLAAGRYTVLVCADSANKVKEAKETNNCRAASSLTISVQPGGTTPPAGGGGPVVTPPAFQPTATPTIATTPTPAPFTTRLTESPGDIAPLRSARFAFTANEPADGFECRLDAAAFAPCTSPVVIGDILAGEHAFEVRARRGATYAVVARKAWRIEFEAPAPGPTDAPAVAPETKATNAKDGEITLVADTTEFLYTGTNPIQKNVDPGAIETVRASVLRGKVLRRNGTPIEGVRITVVDHDEYGRTATRTDGGFEIAVNGGGSLTLAFEREGYVPSQRQLEVPTQEFERVEEIVMVPYEDRVSGVDLARNELQVAQGSTITDGDGSRRATLLLEPGTEATATLPDGTEKELGDRLNIRATEFTIGANGPAAMPGELPPTSAYTYAVEYSVDEANKDGAVNVEFDKPIVTYVDNIVGFKAGTKVPMGYYDREKAQWVPAPDGVVIAIVSKSGGRAAVDVTGDGVADSAAELAKHGIDDAELRKLADLYAAGKSLWRAAITHFTPWDYNWPYGLPDGAEGPDQDGPDDGDPDGDDPCGQSGSIILCEDQVLGEAASVAGTPYTLVYQSDRVPGRRTGDSLEIPLTNANPPSSLARVDLTIEVAGRTINESFPRGANLRKTFVFDGKDAYGRAVQGRQKVDVTIDYVYPAVYRAPSTFGSSFAAIGGAVLSANRTRQEINVSQRWSGTVGGLNAPASALAGWSVDVHHTYDPVGRTLYMGDGSKRSATGQNFDVISTTKTGLAAPEGMTVTPEGDLLVADSSAHVIRRIAPGGATTVVAGTGVAGWSGDGGLATETEFDHPSDVAVGPDGALYVADEGNNRIRRIGTDGRVSTFAGSGVAGYRGDGGPAVAARLDEPSDVAVDGKGAVYFVDRANHAVRRVGTDGFVTTLAGNGTPGFGGDGGVATSAKLRSPRDVSIRESDGSVFVADGGNHRVRRIDPDGSIETVAGNGSDGYRGDGASATAASLDIPSAVTPLRDGGLLIADAGNATLRKVAPAGTIDTVAGNGTPGSRGDGGPAAQARIDFPQAIALGADDTIYLADYGNDRVRALAPSMPGLSLAEFTVASLDGGSLFVFDRSGRHLRTIDSLTRATIVRFGYDARGRLTEIHDAANQKTTIQRDANGNPASIVGPYGHVTTLAVTGGYLSRVANEAGDQMRFEYRADGLMTKFTDPRNGVHTFEWDPLGRLTKDVEADGSAQTLTRTVAGKTTTVVHATGEGRSTTYKVTRTADGAIKRTVSNQTGQTTTTVTGNDGVITVTRPDGTVATTEEGPDPRFGMQSPVLTRMTITTPSGTRTTVENTRTVELNSDDKLDVRYLTETSTVNGKTSTTRFEKALSRVTSSSSTGRTVTTEIDEQRRPKAVSIPGITTTVNTFDGRGRITRVAQGSRTTNYGYDARGRLASSTDPRSRVTEYTYDLADRLTSIKRPNGRQQTMGYDAMGNVTAITPPGLGGAHQWSYSARNGLAGYTPPALSGAGATTYTSDRDGLATGVALPGGLNVNFTHDASGRLKTLTQPRGATALTYAAGTGQIASATAFDGERTDYTFDGPLVTGSKLEGTVDGEVKVTYDADMRQATETAAGVTAAFEYDDDGMITKAGTMTLTRDVDNGQLTRLAVGSSTTDVVYNELGELQSATTKQGSAAVFSEAYGRDGSGRISTKSETRGTGAPVGYTYGFDGVDRLTEVRRGAQLVAEYKWDDNGNRLSVQRAGDALPTVATYDVQDRLTQFGATTYTYTAAGDLATKTVGGVTTTYDYDQLGALRSVKSPSLDLGYVIDAAGRRVGVKENGVLVQGFLYGTGMGPAAELNPDGTIKSRFIYSTRKNVPSLMIRGGKTYRIVTDQLGSPRAVVDTSNGSVVQALDYDEFGRVVAETGEAGFQPFGFAGGLYDRKSGLTRFGARDYDPETGRFTTKDPLSFGGGDSNLYAYAQGDPINLADPTGLWIDTVVDVISIGYDVYQIGKGLMNGCGVDPWDVAALGADVAGAIIPGFTGGGAMVRAARGADAASNMVRGTNRTGELTSRSTFRKGTTQDNWDNATPGPTGGRLCPTCGNEVHNAPGSGQPRDWDNSHNPSWTNREFDPNNTTRQDVVDNYNEGTRLECIPCNRGGGNDDSRFGGGNP